MNMMCYQYACKTLGNVTGDRIGKYMFTNMSLEGKLKSANVTAVQEIKYPSSADATYINRRKHVVQKNDFRIERIYGSC
jgi:hypothetical protein